MKKFIALALALAMMVSCLVFTVSADNSVAVTLQGPTTVVENGTFQVKVRVTDVANVVGGVQGTVDVTGATVTNVQVNPDLLDWNKTSDETTIYKLENNDVTFASLNKLVADTYDTRVWFIIDYQVNADVTDVSVVLNNVKVSDKTAKAVTSVATNELTIGLIDEADPSVSLAGVGIDGEAVNVNDQAILINAEVKNINLESVTDIGVIFYPTSLLGGEDLTVNTQGAVIANVNKADDATTFNKINRAGYFIGALDFNFTTDEKAYAFLGTKVTARVYYKTTDGAVVYASNNVDGNKYIKNGVANKAALNTILNKANSVTEPTFGSVDEYNTKKAGLNTSNLEWMTNRAYVLEYCVKNAGK